MVTHQSSEKSLHCNCGGRNEDRVCRDKTGLELGMKESYEERLANDFDLQRRCDCGNNVVLSVRDEGKRRPAIELRNHPFRVPTSSCRREGNIECTAIGKVHLDAAESENLCMCGNSKRENREIPLAPARFVECRAVSEPLRGQG